MVGFPESSQTNCARVGMKVDVILTLVNENESPEPETVNSAVLLGL